MRNKHTPKRGGNTGKGGGSTRSSNNNTPEKDSQPDKSKGLARSSAEKVSLFQLIHPSIFSPPNVIAGWAVVEAFESILQYHAN